MWTVLLSSIVTGVAVYFATIEATKHGAIIGYEIVASRQKEADKQRIEAAKVVAVECESADLWDTPQGCSECHGQKKGGGRAIDWENKYRFTVRATQPLTLTEATLHIHRVRLLSSYYALCPDVGIEEIDIPVAGIPVPAVPTQAVERCYVVTKGRQEVRKHHIVLRDLKDIRATLPSTPLGHVDIGVGEAELEFGFSLGRDYEKEVQRLKYQLVEVLAEIVFHSDDGIDIPTDPFLIAIRVNRLETMLGQPAIDRSESYSPTPVPAYPYEPTPVVPVPQ